MAERMTDYRVSSTRYADEALDIIARSSIEAVILDAYIDGPEYDHNLGPYEQFPFYLRDGLWALDEIKALNPSQRVVMIIDNVLDLDGFCLLQGAEKVFTVPYCTSPLIEYLLEKDPYIRKDLHIANE